MERFPAVSVIVPVRDGEATIAACLGSVMRSDYPASRRDVIVVDNGSSDRTAAIVKTFGVRYLQEPTLGPSSARNRGIEESRTELVGFIDADCIATSAWLRELVAGFETQDVSGVAGEILSYPAKTPVERYMAMRHPRWQQYALAARRPYAVTANVAFRRETFRRIGTFDPRLTRAQDMDFGWRFFGGGLRMQYAPKALVFHRHRATTRTFFRQQFGWGHGRALLQAKYGLPWRLRDELAQYGKLGAAVYALTWAATRHASRRGDQIQLSCAYYEMLRRAAVRLGALHGLLATRLVSPWSAASCDFATR